VEKEEKTPKGKTTKKKAKDYGAHKPLPETKNTPIKDWPRRRNKRKTKRK